MSDAPLKRRPRVFQVGYDPMLNLSREQVLRQRGYDVVSAVGNAAAVESLGIRQPFDAFLVGHAASDSTRREIIRWLKREYPEVKVIALNPPHCGELAEADYNVALNGPEAWLHFLPAN